MQNGYQPAYVRQSNMFSPYVRSDVISTGNINTPEYICINYPLRRTLPA